MIGEATARGHGLDELEHPRAMRLVDRRQAARAPVRRPIGIRVTASAAGDAGQIGLGMSCDVSACGMRFETTLRLALGDRVAVSLIVSPDRIMSAFATVVRLDDPPHGREPHEMPRLAPWGDDRKRMFVAVRFERVDPADAARLESLVGSTVRAAGPAVTFACRA